MAFSTLLGYLLRLNFDVDALIQLNFEQGILINTLSVLLAIVLTRSHTGIVRYTGLKDGFRLLNTLVLALLLVTVLNLVFYQNYRQNLVPYSVVLISFLASFLFLFQYRLLIKNVFSYYKGNRKSRREVIIFGAGQLGMITKQVIESDDRSDLRVVCFFEDDANKAGKVINGTPIVHAFDLKTQLTNTSIDELIIAVQNLSIDRKNDIVNACLQNNITVRTVPKVRDWVQGELSLRQIKEVRIEDLLGREAIKLDSEAVSEELLNKTVCITGAAGSIGSELVRQVVKFRPCKVILIDQAESPLYILERELQEELHGVVYVADIRDKDRMNAVFHEEKPDVIFHAAAYKHVPLMESNVAEAVKTNIIGTKNLADLAVKHGVERFVMVSTDKAVNPTSVMGCTKRIAEIYVQSLNTNIHENTEYDTVFVTTRFGNVLGSNGSVIPFFKKQISEGGPVTVTHPDITRYFMTITEACQLVLEAGAMGNGGEIFIFDMGQSVKIVDLAKKMILLSGLELDRDIEIIYTGLRKGEKLYEELLADKENTLPTHHEKIMIAKVAQYSFEDITNQIDQLDGLIKLKPVYDEIVSQLKIIVPEFSTTLDFSEKVHV